MQTLNHFANHFINISVKFALQIPLAFNRYFYPALIAKILLTKATTIICHFKYICQIFYITPALPPSYVPSAGTSSSSPAHRILSRICCSANKQFFTACRYFIPHTLVSLTNLLREGCFLTLCLTKMYELQCRRLFCSCFLLFVRMNALISGTIRVKTTKLGGNVSCYCTQLK